MAGGSAYLLRELVLHDVDGPAQVHDGVFHLDQLVLRDGRIGEQLLRLLELLPLLVDLDAEALVADLSVLLDLVAERHEHLLRRVVRRERLLRVEQPLLARE